MAPTGRLAVLGGTHLLSGAWAAAATPLDLEVPGRHGPTLVPMAQLDDVVLLQRHHGSRDPGRSVPAHLIDHRANMAALVEAGCDRLLAVGSVGALSADWPIGTVVAPDDFFAPTVTPSFFDDLRGHTVPGFATRWRAEVIDAWRAAGVSPIVDGGVYAQTLGPRFETPAEVRFLAMVADLVGMTVAAECVLAREAGLDYAAVCMVDYLANGIGGQQLTVEAFEAQAAEGDAVLARVLERIVPVLARR
jgi:5'-methylthioadenosine phosphorylase